MGNVSEVMADGVRLATGQNDRKMKKTLPNMIAATIRVEWSQNIDYGRESQFGWLDRSEVAQQSRK